MRWKLICLLKGCSIVTSPVEEANANEVGKHSAGIGDGTYLAERMIDPGDWNFGNAQTKRASDPQHFHIEAESFDPLTRKDRTSSPIREQLETALCILDSGQGDTLYEAVEYAAHHLTPPWLWNSYVRC